MKPAVDSLFSITFSFCFFISLSLQQYQNTNTNTNTYTEREMGVVVGVILDESVMLASNSPQHENPSLQPVADYLLRKLRHSKIPSVFSLSLLQLHCSLPNILLQPFWVFFDLRFMVNYSIFMYL